MWLADLQFNIVTLCNIWWIVTAPSQVVLTSAFFMDMRDGLVHGCMLRSLLGADQLQGPPPSCL
jgi:hypothetical protein